MQAILREGSTASALGATAVAVWFFFIDLLLDQPFATPESLGGLLLARPVGGAAIDWVAVAGYTVFHYAAFGVVGIAVALVVEYAKAEPTVLAGALILFVVIEVAFQALLSMFGSIPSLGVSAWYNVAAGNLIAALTMGVYMWRVHPELRGELRHAMGGGEE